MANSVTFGTKRFLDVLLGNRAVKQLWLGSHLIWEKVGKLLALDSDKKFICIEYIPAVDTNVSSLSVFIKNGTSYGWTCILNECGLCVAVKNESGTSSATIYGLSANLITVSSFGSPKLLAGRKYYIAFKISQWDSSNTKFAYYQGMSGNYKICEISGVTSVCTQVDLQTVPCVGSIYHLGTYDSNTKTFSPSTYYGSECTANTLFIWRGGYINNQFKGSDLAMCNYRDMSKFRCLITDAMLLNCSSDMQRLALIYYIMGNTENNEIAWGCQNNYQNGITVNGVNMFNKGVWKIYKASGSMGVNHVTSMTPLTAEPVNKDYFGIYYKGQTSSGWLDEHGDPITSEMVVVWFGDHWGFAGDWEREFSSVNDYTFETAADTIADYSTQGFNATNISTDKKYYLRINGNEV